MVWRYQESFGSGELDPAFQGGTGLEIYRSSAIAIKNAFIKKARSLCKRHGSIYHSGIAGDQVARLAVYHVQSGVLDFYVILVLVNTLCYLYDGETGVELNSGIPIPSPYTTADLPLLSFRPLPDELLIQHPNREERSFTVTYTGAINYLIDLFDTGNTGPRLNEFTKKIELTRGTSYGVEIYDWLSSSDYFTKEDEKAIFFMNNGFFIVFDGGVSTWYKNRKSVRGGQFVGNSPENAGPTRYWQGSWQQQSTTAQQISATATTGPDQTSTLTKLSGTWSKSQVGDIVDLFPISSQYQVLFLIVNYLTTTTVTGIQIRVNHAGGAGDASHQMYNITQRDKVGRAVLTASSKTGAVNIYSDRIDTFDSTMISATEREPLLFINGGVIRLVSVVSGGEATGTVLTSLSHLIPTTDWAMGPSASYGYSSNSEFHQNRLSLAGYKGRFGRSFALSRIRDYHEFTTGVLADDAIDADIIGEEGSIRWQKSTDADLIMGSDYRVHRVSGDPVTPTEIGIDIQSEDGGASLPPVQIDTAVHFVGRHKDEIFETSFRFQSDKYQARVVSIVAAHLFGVDSIKEWHLVDGKNPFVFIIREDDSPVAFSRDDSTGVLGFCEWSGIVVHSAVSVPRTTGDVLFMCVDRVIGGVTKRYLEYLDAATPLLDSMKVFTSPATTTLTGLSRLEGRTVRCNIDGADQGELIVSGGSVTIPFLGSTVYIGLPYRFSLKPQYIAGAAADGQVSQGRSSGIANARFMVSSATEGLQHNGKDLMAIPRSLTQSGFLTKWLGVPSIQEQGVSPTLEVTHDSSNPCEVMCVSIDYNETGKH